MSAASMKKLVVFYSLDGNTEYVAKIIKDSLKADILKLEYKNPGALKGGFKYLAGGFQVLFRTRPKLKEYKININNYDIIIFGSPVWAGSYSPAFNTFFSDNQISGKKIVLFSCYSGSSGSTINNFKKALINNKVIAENSFKDPYLKETKGKDNKNKIIDWVKNIERSLLMSDSKKKTTKATAKKKTAAKKPAAKKPAAKKPAAKKPAAKKPAAKKPAAKKK